jgi:hypothetical protein
MTVVTAAECRAAICVHARVDAFEEQIANQARIVRFFVPVKIVLAEALGLVRAVRSRS